jgi:hypothetical protein
VILGTHHIGQYNDLIVKAGPSEVGSVLMEVTVLDADQAGNTVRALEFLERSDVERLRDLCNEALS